VCSRQGGNVVHAPTLRSPRHLWPLALLDPELNSYGRDSAYGQPDDRGISGTHVSAKAAYRLAIILGGTGDIMRFGPNVDAHRMQVDGGQLGGSAVWARGCCRLR
jgi:hypothetical protein